MNLLLDTVTFLWILEDAQELSPAARAALEDTGNVVYLSAVSAWEITLKHRLRKLQLPEPPETLIPRQRSLRGIESLSLGESATLRVHLLPDLHRDPFDRMLASQAIEHAMTLVTPDALLRAYPVRVLW